jgi:putative DNA primase/helicase
MRVSIPYDERARCPEWEAKLLEIFGGDTEMVGYFQRAVGYSLSGDCREECLFVCHGDGANGKGTTMNTVAWVLGDYADDLPFSAFELHARSSIPNDIAKLVGKRFVTASESGEVRLNEARVKALTGRDPITARFLHREFFTFQPAAKFWLATNMRPVVRDDSEGFWRRIHLIPFAQSFVGREDKTLKDRLRDEAQGILAWIVRGCLAWQREGLNPPSAVLHATDEYRREQQQLGRFMDTRCIVDATQSIRAETLFHAYRHWCDSVREGVEYNQTTFGKAIKSRFRFEERNRRIVYIGIGLRSQGGDVLDGGPF